MNCKKLFTTLLFSSLLFAGCSLKNGDVIIKVNNDNIKKSQYDALYDKAVGNSMFAQLGIDVKNDPESFIALMIKDKVVNELVIKSLLEQEIKKRNIKVTKAETDAELQTLVQAIGSKEKLAELLKQKGISSSQLKSDIYDQVKLKKLVNIISKVNVTDADAKKFYNENKNQFKYPERVRASHILISADSENIKQIITSNKANKNLSKDEIQKLINDEMAAKKVKAEKILAEVKKSPDSFAKIAEKESEDPASAKKGGDLGYFSKQEMVEPFAKVAFSIKPNTISEIVQTPYGYQIIIVQDRVKAGMEPFEKVKESIKAYLINQEQTKILENLVESLKKQAKIEYLYPEYNPANIQEKLKKQAKNSQAAQEELNPSASSATPTPSK